MRINKCNDCGPLPVNHFHNWLNDFSGLILENALGRFISNRIFIATDQLIYKFLIKLGFLRRTKEINKEKVSLRTTVFLDEAGKQGIDFCCLESAFGPINHFEIKIANRSYFFEGLPRGEQSETRISKIIDDKAKTKKILQSVNLPTPKGKDFYWFQKKSAIRWAKNNLNFPLIVKPRFGSMSQHITADIQSPAELPEAITKAVRYSPAFIIEEFLTETMTYRATVTDCAEVATVKRVPAHIIGNGKNTISELIAIKNKDSRRGNPKEKNTTLYKLVFNENSEKLLKKSGHNLNSVPKKGEIVYTQDKVILDLGADLFEETDRMHPDNKELFQKIAKLFNIRLVGIDFLIKDISLSWKTNPCAIIELNSLPYIDMHHFPTTGQPVNIAAAICKLIKKYY